MLSARRARQIIRRARSSNLKSRTVLDSWMSAPDLKDKVKFTTSIEEGQLVFGAELRRSEPATGKGRKSRMSTPRPPERVAFRCEPQVDEKRYDFQQDWDAWKHAVESRGRGFFSTASEETPSEAAILAAQIAAEDHWRADDPLLFTAETVKRAADVTAYFGSVKIAWTDVQPYRGDLLIASLNRYPHSKSAACRWLVPALRNLVGMPREAPDELWSHWRDHEERLYRLSLHPRSTIFQGSPEKHNLVDYELESHGMPISRTHLDRWRIRAHLMNVPTAWKCESGRLVEGRPRLLPARLNALTMHVVEVLRNVDSERQTVEPTTSGFRLYLLKNAADSSLPMTERRRYKKALARLNEASEYNLLRRTVFTLDYYHIREYRTLLCGIEMEWRWSRTFTRLRRRDVRMKFLTDRGWKQTPEIDRLLGGRAPWECLPREVAGLLVCMREELQFCHPQTFAEALVAARKLHPEEDPVPASGKRRGRPAHPREFSPSTPSSD